MLIVAAFYQFTDLPEYADYKTPLAALACGKGVKGIILLAPEGVNGTIAGSREGVDAVLAAVRALPGCAGMEHKESTAETPPFKRLKVRLKKEIVTMGVEVDASGGAGTYVAPEDWNALIEDPSVALIDARNAYEVAIGRFDGAVDPKTDSFGEFPAWLDAFRAENPEKKTLAMYCTGGIRCEKATAYAKAIGYEDVYHLKGGILKYLEETRAADSRWNGECYVFDGRVAVGHGLAPGEYEACGACGLPVGPEGRRSPHYRRGVSCEACHDVYTAERQARFAERQRQLDLADAREPKP